MDKGQHNDSKRYPLYKCDLPSPALQSQLSCLRSSSITHSSPRSFIEYVPENEVGGLSTRALERHSQNSVAESNLSKLKIYPLQSTLSPSQESANGLIHDLANDSGSHALPRPNTSYPLQSSRALSYSTTFQSTTLNTASMIRIDSGRCCVDELSTRPPHASRFHVNTIGSQEVGKDNNSFHDGVRITGQEDLGNSSLNAALSDHTTRAMSYPLTKALLSRPLQMAPRSIAQHSIDSSTTAVISNKGTDTFSCSQNRYPLCTCPSASLESATQPRYTTEERPTANDSLPSNASSASPTRLPRTIRALRDSKNPKCKSRTIVICLDGTGDQFDADNSNIVHIVSCLKKSDASQVTYYQSGIGTYDGGGLSNGFNAVLDMAIASGLGVHIRDAYHFLMQNYHENDRICLFGFSRGAYTARCLAGMVHKVGLLPAHNVQQIPFAYQYYKDDSAYGWKMSREFKKTFCMDVSIHFIGVFDSVASVGFIPRTLPLSSTPWNKATYFRHAMALDEHRAKFQIKQFEKKDNVDERVGSVADSDEESMYNYDTEGACTTLGKSSYDSSITADDGEPVEAASYWQRMRQQEHQKQTDVLEVWFTGAHADVGGGAVENERRHKLAQIPLRWMLRQCFECDTGIIFKIHCLAEQGIDVHTLWPTYTPLGIPHTSPSACLLERHKNGDIPPICRRSTVLRAVDEEDPHSLHEVALWKDERQKEMKDDWIPEHTEDYFDSISDIHDQLVDTKAWWILEFWPTKMKLQLQDSRKWIRFVSLNLGRYRAVQDLSPNLHWTVQQRIKSIGYKINLRLDKDASWKIAA